MIDTDTELKALNGRLQKVVEGFENMRAAGIDEDLLVSYMCYKLHKSSKEVKKILACYEEFYEKLIKKMALKRLKESV